MLKRKLTKVVAAVVIIGLAAGYLLYKSVSSSWVYYYTADEFIASPFSSGNASKPAANPIIRIAGLVKSGSIVKNPGTMQLDFELVGTKKSIPVQYKGPEPANFEAGKEVVVEGKVAASGIFQADKVLTRCESKYKIKLDANAK